MKKHTLLLACAMRILLNLIALPLRGKCRRQYVQANWIFRSEATRKSSETPFRAQRDGACQRSSNNVGYIVVLPPQPFGHRQIYTAAKPPPQP